jgi:PhzF family phenazine biosynthesis protein
MLAVAQELRLETAFLLPEDDGYRLRWFTPVTEVDLCGHATLASAHVLWSEGCLPRSEVAHFSSRSGPLAATQSGEWIELDLPSLPVESIEPPTGLVEALGVTPRFVGRNRLYHFVELESERDVRGLQPDFRALGAIPMDGLMVTSRSEHAEYDFVTRFFAPWVGIDEDHVTGSAHCAHGPYWSARLGKDTLLGYQASPRGGFVRVAQRTDRVGLGGKAISVLRGELLF